MSETRRDGKDVLDADTGITVICLPHLVLVVLVDAPNPGVGAELESQTEPLPRVAVDVGDIELADIKPQAIGAGGEHALALPGRVLDEVWSLLDVVKLTRVVLIGEVVARQVVRAVL